MTTSNFLRCCNLCVMGAAMSMTLISATALAADLTVNVKGIVDAKGEIGCALFREGEGFPMGSAKAKQIWLRADAKGVTCNFSDLTDGSYAVSASHDLNGNRKIDTNFLGMPTESWGVSNNARPSLRAPRFEEAVVKVIAGKDMTIDIKVDK